MIKYAKQGLRRFDLFSEQPNIMSFGGYQAKKWKTWTGGLVSILFGVAFIVLICISLNAINTG